MEDWEISRIRFVSRVEPPPTEVERVETARLIIRFQAGESEAFAGIYERYFDRVFNYLRAMVRNQHDAEDLVQDVFFQLVGELPRFEVRQTAFASWLFTVVKNDALDHLKRSRRMEAEDPAELDRRLDENGGEIDTSLLARLSDQDLLTFTERMPLPQRQVLMLRYMMDMSVAETAEVLGRSPSAVRLLQHRAFAFLRQRLSALGRKPTTHVRPRPARRIVQPHSVLRARRFALHL